MKQIIKQILAALVLLALGAAPGFAGWSVYQTNGAPPVGTFSVSIPAGNFTQATQTNGSIVANSDGTTNGVSCANTCYANMYTLVNFPSNDTCTFSVQAFQTVNPGILDQNAVSVGLDGEPIPAVGVADRNLWAVSVTNASPAQSYNFSVPLLAGIHQVTLGMGLPQNNPLQSGSNPQGFHIDRVNITCSGTGIPTEPAPQTRDPFNYPYSSYDFWNTAIGSGITWSIPDQTISSGTYSTSTGVITLTLSGSPPHAFTVGQYAGLHNLTGTGSFATLNGAWAINSAAGTSLVLAGPTGAGAVTITGGKAADADQMTLVSNINGTAIGFGVNSGSWSVPIYQGTTGTNPVGAAISTDNVSIGGWMNGQQPFYLAINSGDTTAPPACSAGGDCSIAIAATGNHRYFYMGSNPAFVWGNAQQTNVSGIQPVDAFRLYSSVDEGYQIGGLIRAQDITDGVIAHTLVAGNTYVMQSSGNVNAPGGTASTLTGSGWPMNYYDYVCFNGGPPTNCTGYIQPGELFGLPSSVNCSTLGLSAGGLMLCHALQDYGAFSDVQTGSPSGPQTQLYAEQGLSGNATLTALTTDYTNILGPLLQIARNNTSFNFFAGGLGSYAKGGGTPRQGLRPGLNLAAYPSNVTSTTASGLGMQPAGFPTAFVAGDNQVMFPYQSVPVNFNFAIPTGSTLVCLVGGATASTFSAPVDTQGNTWTIAVQNAGNSGAGLQAMALAYTVNTTHALTASDTFSITDSGGSWRASCWGITGAVGGFDKAAMNLTTTAALTSSVAIGSALAQARELVMAFTVGSNSGSIMPSLVEPFNSYELYPNQNPIRMGGGWEITAATTAPTATWNWVSNNATTVNAIIAFKMP